MDANQTTPDKDKPFSREVGLRLRAIRRQRTLSLDDVERLSGGRWSASAIGAYERGFRNLSLPRLHELADFYGVPMGMLLGERDMAAEADVPSRIVLDLTVIEGIDDAAALARYAQAIVSERGDWNGRVLSVRRDDVRALCSMLHTDERGLLDQLTAWGALVDDPRQQVHGAGTEVAGVLA